MPSKLEEENMKEEKLVTCPKLNRTSRDRLNSLTKELQLGKFSNTVGFLLGIYDLLFTGREFKTATEMILFIQTLLEEKELLARENRELKTKLKDIQKIIDE